MFFRSTTTVCLDQPAAVAAEVPVTPLANAASQSPAVRLVDRPARPAVMVFSWSGLVLYANETAHRYLPGKAGANGVGDDGVRAAMTELIDQMTKESRSRSSSIKQLEARRLIVNPEEPLLMRAFEIPDRIGSHQSRIVITIEQTPSLLKPE